jgi:hypothetical protein
MSREGSSAPERCMAGAFDDRLLEGHFDARELFCLRPGLEGPVEDLASLLADWIETIHSEEFDF